MNLLTVLLLFSSFVLTQVSNLRLAVKVLLAQSVAVAAACLWSGIESEAVHTYVAALLTVVIKAGMIPYALMRVVRRLRPPRRRRLQPRRD